MPQSDVVIIGAGAIGCSIAYHLGKRGMRATVVEREAGGSVERQFFDESGHSMGVDVCAEEVSQAVARFFCDRLDELTSD